jgi:hypothetical protein
VCTTGCSAYPDGRADRGRVTEAIANTGRVGVESVRVSGRVTGRTGQGMKM